MVFSALALASRGVSGFRNRFGKVLQATACCVFVLAASHLYAANDLWVGATTANWADPNWTGGNNPPLTGDSLFFGVAGAAGTTLNNNLAVNTTVNSLTYNAGGSGFTTNGNQAFLVGNITNNSTAGQILNLPILTTRGTTVTLTAGGGNVTIGGAVTGGGGFTTAGSGTLTINSATNLTGGSTGAANTVIAIGNSNALQYSTVTLNSTTANSLTFAPGVTSVNLGGLASAAGAGSFSLTDGTNPVTITAGINNGGTTYNGVMSGGGSYVKVGTGTQTFAGANTYSGTTTVNNGTLAITGASFGSTGLVLGGGALTVNNASANLNFATGGTTLNGGASTITDTAGSVALGGITRNTGSTLNLTLTVSNVTSTTGTASTILTDSGAAYATVGQDWAAKNAANTNIVGLSTIAGGYTNTTATTLAGNADVAAGVDTTLAADANISSLRFNQAQARSINLGSSTLTTGGILHTTTVAANASIITGGTLKGAAGKDLVVIQNNTTAGGALTIASTISDNTSATGLTKAGAGTLVLTGNNNYTGTTRVNGGALQFSTLGNLGTGPIVLSGGALQYATGSTVDLSTRNVTFHGGNGSVGGSIDTNGNNVTFANVIGAGSTGSLIKTGAGTLTLSAANAVNTANNPFIGVQVSGGVLQLGNANTVQNGTLTVGVNNGLAFSSGIGTFNVGALAGGNNFALVDVAAAPVTLSVGANNLPTSYNGALQGSGSLVKVGTGVLSLGGAGGSFTGNVVVNEGVLTTGTGASVNNSVFGSPLAAGRSITVNSGATMQWTSNNIFGNGIGVNVANVVPIVVNGGTFFSNRYNWLPNITLNGGSLLQAATDGPGTFEGFVLRGNITVGGSVPSYISANTPAGQVNLKHNHLAFNTNFSVADATGNANADLIVSAGLADTSGDFGGGVGGFTKTGPGTMLVTGLSAYQGDTTVSEGTLALGGITAPLTATTATWANGSAIITGLPSTAGLVVGQPVTGAGIPARARIQSIDSATQVTLSNNSTAAGAGTAITFGIAGALGGGTTSTITVAPGATLDSTAATGGLILQGTQRLLNNGTMVGTVTANGTSIVGGTGTYSGAVTIAGGSLAPGNSIGTVNLSSLSMTSGTLALEFGGASSDVVNVSGAANFSGGALALSLGGSTAPTALSYDVLTAGTLTGAPTLGSGTLGRTTYTIDGTAPANVLRIKFNAKPAANLTFSGAAGSGNWDAALTDANWTTADSGIADTTHFYNGDYVTFNDSNGGQYNLSLVSDVAPTIATFNNNSGDYTVNGFGIVGTGSVVKNGSRALSLATINTYSGGTVLNQGVLNINGTSAIGTGVLTINGGTIDNTSGVPITLATNNRQVWANSFGFTGTTNLNLGNGNVTLNSNPTITLAAGTLTVAGPIRDGTGNSITISGNGTLALTGANSYTGTTTVTSGATAAPGGNLAFGAGGTVTVQSGGAINIGLTGAATNALNFNQKQFVVAGDGVGGTGALTNSGNAQQNAYQRVRLSGDASFGGSGRFDVRSGQTGGVNQAVLDLAGFTLTNNNANFFGLVGVEVTDGSIITKAGNLDFETTTNVINFNSGATITIDAGALATFFNYTGTLTRPIIMNTGARLLTNDNTNPTVGSNITLNGNAIFGANNGNGTATMTLNGVISEGTAGIGSITKNVNGTGNSTLVLANSNTFTGGVTVNGGVLQLNNPGALNSTAPNTVTLNGGGTVIPRLRLNGNNVTVASLSSIGGGTATAAVVENNNATTPATLTVNNSNNTTFDGILQNGAAATLSLATTGSGMLTLSGASTYTGSTVVNGGILQLGTGGTNGSINGTSGVSGVAGTTLVFNRSDAHTFTPAVSGAIGITQAGGANSTITLSGTHSYSGATNINSGTLSVTGLLPNTTTLNVNAGGILAGNGNGTTTGKVGPVVMVSGSGLRPGATGVDANPGTITMETLAVSGGDYRVDVGGDLVNVVGLANFTGPSTISPTGAVASGLYTILSAGNLTLGSTPTVAQIPGARVSFNLVSTPGINGTLKLNVIGNAANLVWKGNVSVGSVFPWDVNTTSNWTNTGSGLTDKFFNADNVTFDNTATNKTVNIDTQVLPTSLVVNNSTGNDYTFNGTGGIGGATGLTKQGTGALTINTANSFSGATAIQQGTVVLGNAMALGTSSSLTLGSGANSGVLDLNGNSLTLGTLATSGTGTTNTIGSSSTAATLTVAGGSTFNGAIQDVIGTNLGQTVSLGLSSGTLILTGNSTYTGATTLALGSTLQVGNGGTTGTLGATATTLDSGSALVFNRSTPVRFDGAMSGTGSVQTVGTGTLTLTATNTHTGVTTIAADGSLQLGDAAVNGGATGDLGTGAVTNNGTLIINRTDGDTTTPATIANVISGSGGVTHNGTGFMRLTGNNNFTGNVVVNAGTLIAQTTQQDTGAVEALGNMQLSTKTITVNSGATLQFRINNVYGNQNNPAVQAATANGRNLPTMIINGGTVEAGVAGNLRYNQIGNIVLNGGTLSSWGETGANYSGWQFLGDITVGGSAPSSIITQNGQRNHLGINTVFNVSNATGNADADLIVGSPLRDRSGDYGTGVGNLIKTGTGTMLLSALNVPTATNYANSYTGSTAVNQGTLAVGMANGIAAASSLILGGGKFDTGGFNQALNGLTLSASSGLDLGAGASVMNFTTSPAWDASSTLSVFNWTGTVGVAGGTDQLVFSAGLTPAQVAQIHFQGFNGATLIGNEVVPVSASTRMLGDWNFSNTVTAADIPAMLKALTNLASYKSTNTLTTDDLLNIGDIDSSGNITNSDIQAMLNLVGGGSLASVPEPSTWLLFGLGAAALVGLQRRKRFSA